MPHQQFNRDTRVELAILLKTGRSQRQCADTLGISRTNVCLEINRNHDPDGVYRAAHAHRRALARRQSAKQDRRRIENDRTLRRHIVRKLKLFWSPEQIAGRLKRMVGHTVICHETIYAFVYAKRPELARYLRHQKSKYRKKRGSWARIERNRAMKIRHIGERPLAVAVRERLGDWEGDTIVGREKKQRILTYVERRSGFAAANKLDVVTAEIVEQKTEEWFQALPHAKRQTLTRDNGSEFGDYDRTLEERTGMGVYRATPYCSWERGTNENWNGLLRQFFPKGMPFATVTEDDVQRAVRLLNNRPRKRHGYQTPREVFRGCYDSS